MAHAAKNALKSATGRAHRIADSEWLTFKHELSHDRATWILLGAISGATYLVLHYGWRYTGQYPDMRFVPSDRSTYVGIRDNEEEGKDWRKAGGVLLKATNSYKGKEETFHGLFHGWNKRHTRKYDESFSGSYHV